jgi:hypothetical protein
MLSISKTKHLNPKHIISPLDKIFQLTAPVCVSTNRNKINEYIDL